MIKKQNKLSVIFSPDAILILDVSTKRFIQANEDSTLLYGYSMKEITSLGAENVFIDYDGVLDRLQNKTTATFQCDHRRIDGSVIPVKNTLNIFEHGDTKLLHIVVWSQNRFEIFEKHLSEETIKDNSIIDNYSGFIYTISKDYKIEFMNKTLIKHVGYNAIGSDCYRLIHGLDEKCSWCLGEQVLSGESANFEYKSPKNNRWYYYISTPRFDAQGEVDAQQLIAIDIHDRKKREEQLEQKEKLLRRENLLLKSAAANRYGLGELIGKSLKMQEIYSLILEVAVSDASVLIYGESGTGKELTANAIHALSSKEESRPLFPVNCGGIPDALIESEFFGYKKGAFSGAHIDKVGFLEIADGGTLFLDEIGEINLNMQVKLLRALDGDGFTPLGSNDVIKPKVRIISATNRDLEDLVEKKRMRSDFYYRINVVPIYLPPLRERRDDIPLLIYHFLKKFCKDNSTPYIPSEIMTALEQYDWPGNIRELQNIIHRYVTLNSLDVFESIKHIAFERESIVPVEENIEKQALNLANAICSYEKKIISHYLQKNRWNQSKTAMNLGINRKTLFSKIKKHKI